MSSKFNALASAFLVGCASQAQPVDTPSSNKVPSLQSEPHRRDNHSDISREETISNEKADPRFEDIDSLRAESYRLQDEWVKQIYYLPTRYQMGPLTQGIVASCTDKVADPATKVLLNKLKKNPDFIEGGELCRQAKGVEDYRRCHHALLSSMLEPEALENYYRADIRESHGMVPCVRQQVKDAIREMSDPTFVLTDTNFDAEVARGVTLVDFYSDHCGPCRLIEPIIQKIARQHGGAIKVGRLDIEKNFEVPERIFLEEVKNGQKVVLPCLQVYEDGVLLGEIQGARPETLEEEILSNILQGHFN